MCYGGFRGNPCAITAFIVTLFQLPPTIKHPSAIRNVKKSEEPVANISKLSSKYSRTGFINVSSTASGSISESVEGLLSHWWTLSTRNNLWSSLRSFHRTAHACQPTRLATVDMCTRFWINSSSDSAWRDSSSPSMKHWWASLSEKAEAVPGSKKQITVIMVQKVPVNVLIIFPFWYNPGAGLKPVCQIYTFMSPLSWSYIRWDAVNSVSFVMRPIRKQWSLLRQLCCHKWSSGLWKFLLCYLVPNNTSVNSWTPAFVLEE